MFSLNESVLIQGHTLIIRTTHFIKIHLLGILYFSKKNLATSIRYRWVRDLKIYFLASKFLDSIIGLGHTLTDICLALIFAWSPTHVLTQYIYIHMHTQKMTILIIEVEFKIKTTSQGWKKDEQNWSLCVVSSLTAIVMLNILFYRHKWVIIR